MSARQTGSTLDWVEGFLTQYLHQAKEENSDFLTWQDITAFTELLKFHQQLTQAPELSRLAQLEAKLDALEQDFLLSRSVRK